MIKLFKLADNEFITQCLSMGLRLEGNTKETIEHLFILGVDTTEINLAMKELTKNSHDVADFGVNRMFTFTKKMDLAA